jgi:4-nitrophenyl phosphatase
MEKSAQISAENVGSFLTSFDNFVFDCDGVLWRSGNIIPGVLETLQLLRKMVGLNESADQSGQGKGVFFCSNNSTSSREDYQHKMQKLLIHAKKVSQILA